MDPYNYRSVLRKEMERQKGQAIWKKVKQILDDPHRFKPLSASMKNKHRVHIYKSFVLVYEIHEKEKIVELWDYDHHDKMYNFQVLSRETTDFGCVKIDSKWDVRDG